MGAEYRLRFFFEWGGGCLWPDDDAARERFGLGPVEEALPLSEWSLARIRELSAWHDRSLNWEYPPHPGPWRQEECDRFNRAWRDLLETIRSELGPRYRIECRQPDAEEDPDLDRWLEDPEGFRSGG